MPNTVLCHTLTLGHCPFDQISRGQVPGNQMFLWLRFHWNYPKASVLGLLTLPCLSHGNHSKVSDFPSLSLSLNPGSLHGMRRQARVRESLGLINKYDLILYVCGGFPGMAQRFPRDGSEHPHLVHSLIAGWNHLLPPSP
jgi:hypothetical protein